ncbi:3-hydroxyacyl-CoA dehydrogenase NAD-binding domain-containing protein [Methylobacterium symbioticum]|uniref:Fatty acid oxidation complex subunit alpha n=1 Tax=Methylobacterium symbioticum TaxID=2584084 RepID=A0A509E8Z2_9HYPH|nr:3-hydroxyacyl-CoA dehydrogenase NAD-binding domain-containing protein [Methylobacterium symbioticum]VUD69653.1 Fatty acid oxidation complex subunit alpha [Methylobacterium symbioticum]
MSDRTEMRREGRVAVITLATPPVNALGASLRESLARRIAEAGSDPEVSAIVLTGAGKLFCGGADITEFGRPPQGIDLNGLNAAVEGSAKPVIAAIHGQALGGGTELALACHHRVATPSARIGLPEVKLGIVPGAGGTQRLPRVVGPRKALEIITSGNPVGARAALETGLVDALTAEDRLVADAIAFAERLIAEGRPSPRIRDRDDRLAEGRDDPGLFDAFRAENAKRFRGFEAPEACIACVRAACTMPFEQGLAFERETFLRLVAGAQSIAQRHVFFAEREAAKIPDLPADLPLLPITRVGIIGAGTMGGGIAMNFLNAGIPVRIVEAKAEALERGLATIRRNYEGTARKGRISATDVETRMGLLAPGLDVEALADCDLVIEAAFENLDLKREIFGRLDRIVKAEAILASNTSYLDIDAIAAATARPERVLGLHFFSPANVMRLLEVVRGAKTAPAVVATAMALGRRIGKIAVLAGVCHGFIGNRILAQRQAQANRLVLEGATPQQVDRVITDLGLPMGPFAMIDLAGLDLGWSRETSKGETVREILCERDRRGQKTGRGFYDYDEARKATPSAEVEAVIRAVAARQGVTQREISDEEIRERCLYPMVNEGAKILDEGKALRASDIDIVWINGYGWPVYSGGPMHWADGIGLARIVERLRALEAEHGPDFTPAPLLATLAAEGGSFSAFDKARRKG